MLPTSHADTRQIEQPAAAAKALPLANAGPSVMTKAGKTGEKPGAGLWSIALLNSPAAQAISWFAAVSCAARRLAAERDLVGSPPKAAILAFTQRSTAC